MKVWPLKKQHTPLKLKYMIGLILELIYGILSGGVIFSCLVFILLATQDIKFTSQNPIEDIFSGFPGIYQISLIASVFIIFNCCKSVFYSPIKIFGVCYGLFLMLYWFNTIFIPSLFTMS